MGSDAADIIYGVDTGATLNGKGGQDTLIGGASDDVLIGGTNKDILIGGGSSDTFLFRQGDNYDTIKDFATGTGGDRIVISGAAAVDDFGDLALSQHEGDVWVRYGANSTIILEGHTVAEITAQSFAFDPAGTVWGGLI